MNFVVQLEPGCRVSFIRVERDLEEAAVERLRERPRCAAVGCAILGALTRHLAQVRMLVGESNTQCVDDSNNNETSYSSRFGSMLFQLM